MTQIVPSGLIERCLTAAGVHEHKNSTVAALNAVLLEQLIECYRIIGTLEPDRERQADAFSRMSELIGERSPERIAEMERAKGLR